MSDSRLHQSLALVVDGGGTKTDCHVLDRAGDHVIVLGFGTATGSNPGAVGIEAATVAIRLAVQRAKIAACLPPTTTCARATLAIAGTVDNLLRANLEESLAREPFARECRVFPDVLPIVFAAATTGLAAGLIAGTGAVVVVRHNSGKYALTGGWGYLLGDEGSGYAIGRDVLRATLTQMEQGMGTSPLAACVLAHLRATSVSMVKKAVYQAPDPRRVVADLSRVAIEACPANDVTLGIVLDSAAADLVAMLQRALAPLDLGGQHVPLTASGGLLGSDSPLRARFDRALAAHRPALEVRYIESPLAAAHVLLSDEVFQAPVQFVDDLSIGEAP